MNIFEWQVATRLNFLIDELSISGYFEENFLLEEWKYDNGDNFIKISWKQGGGYLRCTVFWKETWYLDTIFSPNNGTFLLLALFYFGASYYNIRYVDGNARTNDEQLNSQEQLEDWYRKFGFELVSRDSNWTKMRASIKNRPLMFRFELLHKRIKRRTQELLLSNQAPLLASSHPQDPLSP